MNKLIQSVYDYVVSPKFYTPHTNFFYIISLLLTPLVTVHVIILSNSIGGAISPLLVSYGDLSETSKNSALSVLFCCSRNKYLNYVPNRSHPFVCLAHTIDDWGHYLDS